MIVEDGSLAEAGRSELAAVLAGVIRHIGDVDLVVTGDSSVDVAAKMVPTVLAGELGWPAVAEVTSVPARPARCASSARSRAARRYSRSPVLPCWPPPRTPRHRACRA